jgi:predicted RNA polymerase sigma factor
MNFLSTPRTDAANLITFLRARAIDRMRRQADGAASLQRALEREHTRHNRLDPADTGPSFWILHAR